MTSSARQEWSKPGKHPHGAEEIALVIILYFWNAPSALVICRFFSFSFPFPSELEISSFLFRFFAHVCTSTTNQWTVFYNTFYLFIWIQYVIIGIFRAPLRVCSGFVANTASDISSSCLSPRRIHKSSWWELRMKRETMRKGAKCCWGRRIRVTTSRTCVLSIIIFTSIVKSCVIACTILEF